MIFVISQHTAEHTTDIVIDWLKYFDAPYYRINGIQSLFDLTYNFGNNNTCLEAEDILSTLLSCKSNVIWYRRWIPKDYYYNSGEVSRSIAVNRAIIEHLQQESILIRNYFLTKISYAKILSDFNYQAVNKLRVLEIAAEAGLNVPQGIVTSSKARLKDFCLQYSSIIVKNIGDPTFLNHNDKFYATYTAKLDLNIVEQLPSSFFPSLVQEYIEKQFEIRSFFLDGNFFSMAIFSQENAKTKIDFRKYDFLNPNRAVPYKLPKVIELNLRVVMKKLNLNSGSIDIIKTPDGKFYFLKINPIGQFGMVSEPCNYYLEERVAKWLINGTRIRSKH